MTIADAIVGVLKGVSLALFAGGVWYAFEWIAEIFRGSNDENNS